jgi:haloalkane dehalogenase
MNDACKAARARCLWVQGSTPDSRCRVELPAITPTDMWDLPKAMLSFSWATSLFSLQQIANLATPSAAAGAMDRVTRAIERAYGGAPSADYPFEPHFVDVLGSRMHYIEEGTGAPILLLHGNPTWSYMWRNIVPYLSSLGRCIAPDLIGYGRSDKPDIEYRWRDHVRYLDAFIARMDLRDITLVLHDQGSGLGFHYARRNEHNVRAIAFFEALVRPFPWESFSTPEFREIFRRFRTGGVGGEGWQLLVDQNMFIEVLLPQAAGRPLSDREMDFYREPFRNPASRVPIWRFTRETPIGGEPPDVWEAADTYSRWLQQSPLPKLLLYVTPGALITREHLEWCRDTIRNLELVHIGEGSHFAQESSPDAIGREIADWYRTLDRARWRDA